MADRRWRWITIVVALVPLLSLGACETTRPSESTAGRERTAASGAPGRLPGAGSGTTGGMTGGDGEFIAPSAVTRGSRMRAGIVPLGVVPYDDFVLPLIDPGGRRIATQVGIPPTWSTALAELEAAVPEGTAIEIRALAPGEPSRLVHRIPPPILLGRGADEHGFLVEQPMDDGSRRIGRCDWETARIEWLVDDGAVNAHATFGPDGELVWSRRHVSDRGFDIAIESNGAISGLDARDGESWLFPELSGDGSLLFALRLRDGVLQATAMQPNRSAGAMRQSLRTLTLTNRATPSLAFQVAAPRAGAGHDLGQPSNAWVFFHPGERRMTLWWPRDGRSRGLQPTSLSAAFLDPDRLLVGLAEGVVSERLSDGTSTAPLLEGVHIIRRVRGERWPAILMKPGEGVVGVIGLMLLDGDDSSIDADPTSNPASKPASKPGAEPAAE